jgi:hypothetical protein
VRPRRPLRGLIPLVFAVVLAAPAALGQADPARLEEAKELFRRGVTLLTAGDTERALESFLGSRALVPSGKNTANAAICLERLGRYDEALEMYEEVLARFSKDLDEEDRASLAPVMAQLREKIGYLELSANVDGLVIVDSRARGRLPLQTALRVLPGRRRVRVVKDGYRSFEQNIDIASAQTLTLDAVLEPLAGTGAIRIEIAGDVPLEAVVDGKKMGPTPWEGSLRGGVHVLQTMRDNVGSAPERIEVVEGKTVLVRVSAKPLGAPIRIAVSPASAELFLGDVPLGKGTWAGRLPVGHYEIRGKEPGYFDGLAAFDSAQGGPGSGTTLVLEQNPEHPRWPRAFPWRFDVGLRLSPWFAPTLNSGAEDGCPEACARGPSAFGGSAAGAVVAQHDKVFGAELLLGYAVFQQRFTRAEFQQFDEGTATYALDQRSTGRGPFLALRGRARASIPAELELVTSAGAGAFFGRYKTELAGSVWTTGDAVPATTTSPTEASGVSPFVAATVGVERFFGQIGLQAALGVWFFPTSGPAYDGPVIGVANDCAKAPAGYVGCVPNSGQLVGEKAHGAFLALVPELGAHYSF